MVTAGILSSGTVRYEFEERKTSHSRFAARAASMPERVSGLDQPPFEPIVGELIPWCSCVADVAARILAIRQCP